MKPLLNQLLYELERIEGTELIRGRLARVESVVSRDADRPEWDRIGGEPVREDLGAREVDAGNRHTHPLRAGLPPRRHAAKAVARVVSARDDAELSIRQPAPARSAALPGHEAVRRRAPEGLVQPRLVHLDRLPLERAGPSSHHVAEPSPHAPGC